MVKEKGDLVRVIGEIFEADSKYFVSPDESGKEFLYISKYNRVGEWSGTVVGGVAYIRTGSSPREIGRVTYYEKMVRRQRVIHLERNNERDTKEKPKEEDRPKRTYG